MIQVTNYLHAEEMNENENYMILFPNKSGCVEVQGHHEGNIIYYKLKPTTRSRPRLEGSAMVLKPYWETWIVAMEIISTINESYTTILE